MNEFWNSDIYKIVKLMKSTGNRKGLIAQWRDMVDAWANSVNHPDAESVKSWLPSWQSREFYTAAELAPLFPALSVALGLSKRLTAQKSPKRLENELKFAKLPWVDSYGEIFFIVEKCHQDIAEKIKEYQDAQH